MIAIPTPLVQRILAMLTPDERLVLVLRHSRKLGDAQIAKKLGCTRDVAQALARMAEAKVKAAQKLLIQSMLDAKPLSTPRPKKQPKVRAVHHTAAVQVSRA
ncbi:MAG: hypothetical protein U0636_09375 [Phycisphaerales bacterium]